MHASKEAWHWDIQCHALDSGSGETSHRALDRGEPGSQRSSEGISTGTVKQGKYNDADNSPDDHVLERHHAVLVRAQTIHRLAGLDIILQHTRNFLLLDVSLRWLRTSQPLIGKTCYQLGSNVFQIYSNHNIFGCRFRAWF